MIDEEVQIMRKFHIAVSYQWAALRKHFAARRGSYLPISQNKYAYCHSEEAIFSQDIFVQRALANLNFKKWSVFDEVVSMNKNTSTAKQFSAARHISISYKQPLDWHNLSPSDSCER